MVPGLQVARVNAVAWAVSARGFNGVYSDKLLVLVDGRTVYNPFFSGVYWHTMDMPMEDIERIEVIRGPGATLWGANAVNGVINIITKNSEDAQGLLVGGTISSVNAYDSTVRYGGKVGEDTYFRAFAKYRQFGGTTTPEFIRPYAPSGGIRIDTRISDATRLMFSGGIDEAFLQIPYIAGELRDTPVGVSVKKDSHFSDRYIMGSVEHDFSSNSSIKFQASYNTTRIYTQYTDSDPEITSKYGWDVADFDFHHHIRLYDIHDIVWGADLRFVKNLMTPIFELYSFPDNVNTKQYSLFFQDDVTLLTNKLWLIAGIKLEHNDYTSLGVQPNVRLLFKPQEDHTLWMSVARADRMPSHIEQHIRALVGMEPAGALYQNSPSFIAQLTGTSDSVSEKLDAYEVGYRFIPVRSLSLDIAAFYNNYEKLATWEQGTPFAQGNYYVLPFIAQNLLKGRSYGTEVAAVFQPFTWWRINPSFSWLFVRLTPYAVSTDTQSFLSQGTSPLTHLMVRSQMDISRTLELDVEAHSESALKNLNISGHTDFNLQVGWRPVPKARIAIGVQNLLEKHHPEFTEEYFGTNPIQVQRNIYAKLTWQY
jgi:iron complex outermembrane receptor protein